MSKIKPIVGVTDTEELHVLYLQEFSRAYGHLDNNRFDFHFLVLSALFLWLSYESYINWLIRFLLDNVNRKSNRRFALLWEDSIKNNKFVSSKLSFLKTVFLSEKIEIARLSVFAEKMQQLRNMLVHGSEEYSHTSWSDGRVEKSKLAELLTFQRIKQGLNDFENFTNEIVGLIQSSTIDELTAGIKNKETLISLITFPGDRQQSFALIDE